MIDLTKPRDFAYMRNHDETFYYIGLNNLIKEFSLPLDVYIDEMGKSKKYFIDTVMYDNGEYGMVYDYGKLGLYSDIPYAMIVIDNKAYFASLAEDSMMFTEYPKEYQEKINTVLEFISENYEILLLIWNGVFCDSDICDYLKLKVITVEESIEDIQESKTSANRIRRRLRKLKKHKKLSENFII